ncbi:hypothetical protein NPIL_182542 [Nephila pilipes]|uniref:Uncharacterized protein n=1 Tax=Nephila pilipes TaxID=299642 RepID=A0A8X6QWJ4_NEPPI|nr:hypothetical protein NPIL_182542 [Nephila pilipes]
MFGFIKRMCPLKWIYGRFIFFKRKRINKDHYSILKNTTEYFINQILSGYAMKCNYSYRNHLYECDPKYKRPRRFSPCTYYNGYSALRIMSNSSSTDVDQDALVKSELSKFMKEHTGLDALSILENR